MSEVINLWDKFPKTDERYTKASSVGGHQSTSIAATYMVKLATDVFGPIGLGWGYEVVEERYDQTSPLLVDGVILMDGTSIVWGLTHTIRINLWHGSKENIITQFGHTQYRYMTSKGKIMTDTEAPKKSLTDAMKKCLSLLGVCSDVFMGEFDDAEYRAQAKLENDLSRAEEGDETYISKISDLEEYVGNQAAQLLLCPTVEAMKKIYTLANGKVCREAPYLNLVIEEVRAPLDQAFLERQSQLQPQEKK